MQLHRRYVGAGLSMMLFFFCFLPPSCSASLYSRLCWVFWISVQKLEQEGTAMTWREGQHMSPRPVSMSEREREREIMVIYKYVYDYLSPCQCAYVYVYIYTYVHIQK